MKNQRQKRMGEAMTDGKLLNVDEVAELIGVSRSCLFVTDDCADTICRMLCCWDSSHREADETERSATSPDAIRFHKI